MRILLLLLAPLALALPRVQFNKNGSVVREQVARGGSTALKQATRKGVIERASRPRPKRSTPSGGTTPPSGNSAPFVMQASNSNNANVDGKYATLGSFNGFTNIYAGFTQPSPATANLYYLDSNSYLRRGADGQFALARDGNTQGLNGGSFIYFATAASSDVTNVQCVVTALGTLSCNLANTPQAAAQTQLVVCTNGNNILGIAYPGRYDIGSANYGCIPATISAFQSN